MSVRAQADKVNLGPALVPDQSAVPGILGGGTPPMLFPAVINKVHSLWFQREWCLVVCCPVRTKSVVVCGCVLVSIENLAPACLTLVTRYVDTFV